jgi:hypothetical protein
MGALQACRLESMQSRAIVIKFVPLRRLSLVSENSKITLSQENNLWARGLVLYGIVFYHIVFRDRDNDVCLSHC